MKQPVFIALLLLLFALSGCEITQPDRFYDKSADNDPAFDLYVNGLKADQHIISSITVTLNFTSSTDSVKEFYIYIDDIFDYSVPGNHCIFYFNPSSLSDGHHVLKFYVVAANKGLYSAILAAQLSYTIPFYYDTTPPIAVVVNPAVYKNNHPYLSWNKSTGSRL